MPNILSRLPSSIAYLSLAVIIKDGRKQRQDESKSQQVDEECQEDDGNNTTAVLLLLVISGAAAGFSLSHSHVPKCSDPKQLHLYLVNRKIESILQAFPNSILLIHSCFLWVS